MKKLLTWLKSIWNRFRKKDTVSTATVSTEPEKKQQKRYGPQPVRGAYGKPKWTRIK